MTYTGTPLGERAGRHPENRVPPSGGAGNGTHSRLTDFVDAATLQDVHDSLAVIAQVKTTILDTNGQPLTTTAVSERFNSRSAAIAAARKLKGDGDMNQPFTAPIEVNGEKLATIVMEPGTAAPIKSAQVNRLAKKLQLPVEQVRQVLEAMNEEGMGQRTASVQFLFLLANALSRLCTQEYALRQRVMELTALFTVSTMLSGSRGLQQILDRICRAATDALHVKAASIRLLDENRAELVLKSVYNLSDEYLKKGPVMVQQSVRDRRAMEGHVMYTADMRNDAETIYPEEAAKEGIVSCLCAGMRFKDHAVGVLRVYTEEQHEFSDVETKILQSIASQAAVAIENARLQDEAMDKDRLERQVQIAAEVQRRMMPAHPPQLPGLDICALYVPCFELGGDFYDFIPLGDSSLGITVADVVGKGLPASLLMASVRAALRAHANDIYDLDEILRLVNKSMSIDMQSNEFVTLWYGVLDYKSRQITYCNAGHEPPILIRDGQMRELTAGGMVIGVRPESTYEKEVLQLKKGDILWIYTDGVPDAMNFAGEKFGKVRMRESLMKYKELSAEQMCRQMLWETRRFVGLNRRSDDTTIVVVKVTE
jgi:serine phosphatase RsbU (regulator of sigma subunit)